MSLYAANRLTGPSPACFLSSRALSFLWLSRSELLWAAAGVLGAGSMLPGGLFAVSWDETGGQFEGPIFYVHEWTLVNHLMRAGGLRPLLVCSPLSGYCLRTHLHTQGWTFFDTCFVYSETVQTYSAALGNECLPFISLSPNSLVCLHVHNLQHDLWLHCVHTSPE